jgi:hypothetical protein
MPARAKERQPLIVRDFAPVSACGEDGVEKSLAGVIISFASSAVVPSNVTLAGPSRAARPGVVAGETALVLSGNPI